MKKPNLLTTKELISHSGLTLILATGTDEMVKASYSSSTPIIGVGAGNVPVYIGANADIPFAVKSIISSKTFDNGSICASEKALVVKRRISGKAIDKFERNHCYFMTQDEINKVSRIAYDKEQGLMSPLVVGQSVNRIVEMAEISVPNGIKVLLAQLDKVSCDFHLSAEILTPILAFYVEEDFESSIERCMELTGLAELVIPQ